MTNKELIKRLRGASENARLAPSPEMWRIHGAPTIAWVEEVCGQAASALSTAEERIKELRSHPLMRSVVENSCGDKKCEDYRLDAAIRVLRGGPTHRATAEIVNATEDAWRDAAGTEAVMRKRAEARLALADTMAQAGAKLDASIPRSCIHNEYLHGMDDWAECEDELKDATKAFRTALAAFRASEQEEK